MTDKLFDDELSSKSDGEDQYIDLHKKVVASTGKEVAEEAAPQEESKQELVSEPKPDEQAVTQDEAQFQEEEDLDAVEKVENPVQTKDPPPEETIVGPVAEEMKTAARESPIEVSAFQSVLESRKSTNPYAEVNVANIKATPLPTTQALESGGDPFEKLKESEIYKEFQ